MKPCLRLVAQIMSLLACASVVGEPPEQSLTQEAMQAKHKIEAFSFDGYQNNDGSVSIENVYKAAGALSLTCNQLTAATGDVSYTVGVLAQVFLTEERLKSNLYRGAFTIALEFLKGSDAEVLASLEEFAPLNDSAMQLTIDEAVRSRLRTKVSATSIFEERKGEELREAIRAVILRLKIGKPLDQVAIIASLARFWPATCALTIQDQLGRSSVAGPLGESERERLLQVSNEELRIGNSSVSSKRDLIAWLASRNEWWFQLASLVLMVNEGPGNYAESITRLGKCDTKATRFWFTIVDKLKHR